MENQVQKKAAKVVKPLTLTPRKPIETYTPLGDKWQIKTKLSRDHLTGKKIAEPGQKVDLDAQIQAFKASTDIVSLVARLKAGDTTVLNASQGISGDITVLPKDVNDVMNGAAMSDSAYAKFNQLPDDVKALFGNDPAKFYESVLSNKVDEILANYQASLIKAKEKETSKPDEEEEGGNE